MADLEKGNITKTLFGGIWLLCGNAGRSILQFALSIVLARVLEPDELGLAALILTTIFILQLFSDTGISTAIVQKKGMGASYRDNALYLSFFFGLLICTLLALFRMPLSHMLGYPRLSWLCPLIGIVVLLKTVYAVLRCLMLRNFQYRLIAVYDFINTLLYGFITVACIVLLNGGVESLIYGQLFASIVLVVLGFSKNGFLPTSSICMKHIIDIFNFGSWISLNRIMGQAAGAIDKFLIAKKVSASALGGYYLVHQLATALPSIINLSIDQTMLPVYSRLQDDIHRLEEHYWDTLKYSMLLLFPVIVIPACHSEVLIFVVFGSKWAHNYPLFQIISLFSFIGAMGGGIFGSVLNASGHSNELVKVGIFRITFLPLSVYLGSFYGVRGVCWGLVIFGLVGRLYNQYILFVSLGFSFLRFFKEIRVPVLVSVCLAIPFWNISNDFGSMVGYSFVQCLLFFVAYVFLFPDMRNRLRLLIQKTGLFPPV